MVVSNDTTASSQGFETAPKDSITLTALTTELQQLRQQLAQVQRERQQLETQLAKARPCSDRSAGFFNQLFEKSSDAHLLMYNGLFIDCNWAAVEMLGCDSRAQLLSLHPSTISPEYQPDGRSSLERANEIIATVAQGETLRFEWVHRRLTDEDFWVEVLLVPVELDGQHLVHVTLRDIDARKLADAALQQKEIQYRSIFESIHDGLFISDLETGKVVTVNPANCKMHGYTEEEFIQLHPSEFIHPDSLPQFAHFMASIKAGKQYTCEAVDICKDGTLINIKVTGIPFIYNGLPHALAVVRNISDRKAAENQLKEANTLLTSVLETIPGFFFAKDKQGRHIALNSNLAEFFGRPIPEILGKTDAELLPAAIAAEIMAKDQDIIQTLTTQSFEEVVPTHGTDCTYLTIKTPLYDSDGRVAGMIGLAQDITDRKEIELALRQSEQRFRDVTEAAGEYIWEITADGVYTFVTEQAKAVKGYSPSELLGHTPFEFMPEEDIASVGHIVQTAADQKSSFTLEHRDILPNGEVVWEAVSGVPIMNEHGDITGFRGTGLSITERKTFEQAQARLTAILEATSDFVGIADMDGRQLYMNAAGHHMLEIPLDENVRGMPIADKIPDWAKPIVLQQGIPTALKNGIWQGETAVSTRSGREIPVSQVIISHKDAEGQPEYFSTIVRDITAQKQLEKALQQKATEIDATLQTLKSTQLHMIQSEKMSSLGQLVAGVAHEINNPVGFLKGNIKPAQEYVNDLFGLIDLFIEKTPQLDDEIEEEIETIDLDFIRKDLPELLGSMNLGVDRIKSISTSLRTFSRADKDHKTEFNLHEGMNSTILILKHRLKANDQRPAIEVVKEYGNLPRVACFPGQLNQVFMNILANAIDVFDEAAQQTTFAELNANPQRITIQTAAVGESVQVRISDNGKGMTDEVKARIFDHLFTTKAVGKGTGLGLAIAHQIIEEKHGGKITVESQLGQRTEFILSLPIN